MTYAPSVFDERVKEIDPDARVYYISPFQKNFLKALFDLEKVCGANDYDAVHSHLTTLSAFALTSAAHVGVPVRICHVHSAFNKKSEHYLAKSFLRPFAAEHATHLMACSRHAADNIFGKRAKEAIILPDAIEAEKFYSSAEEYSAARKKLGLDGKVILFVGRFVYQKNLPFLVRAFAAAAENENMTLVLLGDGEARHAIHFFRTGRCRQGEDYSPLQPRRLVQSSRPVLPAFALRGAGYGGDRGTGGRVKMSAL